MGGGAAMYDWRSGGFGLYVHWPFCQSKCPYCDFNSHVATAVNQSEWLTAYLAEIRRYGEETRGRVLQTIYFGGGTPSLMECELVAAIIDEARATWATANDIEITLEANPGSVEASRFEGYRRAGVNRVSVGIQALDDAALRTLGRLHSRTEALRALDIARSTFERVSFDLIYARQNQTMPDWIHELHQALGYAGDHISLYQLTIEDGTAFADRAARGGLRGLPGEDLSAEMYEKTQEICRDAGLPAYEVSNHAREGGESRHNMIYWRAGDYIGVGPGAHGRISLPTGRYSTEAFRNPAAWLHGANEARCGESARSVLDSTEAALEYLLMSLRTNEGLDMARYQAISEQALSPEAITRLEDLGLLRSTKDRLRTTPAGRLVLNGVLRELATS